jgi:hypothetical protein
MLRNPWLNINPLVALSERSKSWNNIIFGTFGDLFSIFWVVANILLFFVGSKVIRRMGQLGRQLSILIILLVSSNWLISLGTLGDHRQRLPILPIILFGQIAIIYRTKYFIRK